MNKENRYEVFCADFSYIVNADNLMDAYWKFKNIFPLEDPFAVVDQQYL